MLIALTLAAALTGPAAPREAEHALTRPDASAEGPRGPGDARGGHPDLDKNHDGFVTRDEFIAPQTAAFDLLDADKDGRISPEEFASGIAAAHVILGAPGGTDGPGGPRGPGGPGGPGGPRAPGGPGDHEGPGNLDADHDGKVSEAEFLAPVREAFQRLDADHSGALEAGERGPAGGSRRPDGPGAAPAN